MYVAYKKATRTMFMKNKKGSGSMRRLMKTSGEMMRRKTL